jgi:hypothetical protein
VSGVEGEIARDVGFLMWRLAAEWRTAMDRVLEPMGRTQAQYAALDEPRRSACGRAHPSWTP